MGQEESRKGAANDPGVANAPWGSSKSPGNERKPEWYAVLIV
jgi:hypothetical protein